MVNKVLFAILFAAASVSASAGTIIGATGAVINSGGPGYGSIAHTYNQAGLTLNYISGVTDFASYLATDPRHAYAYSGNEWFSNSGSLSASVTYNLGAAKTIAALALWNEEVVGVGTLNLFTSQDGVQFTSLASGLVPINNTDGQAYPAQVFTFGAVSAQYVRFDMSNCTLSAQNYCAIGEVAFNQVPEPASLGLMGLALAGLAALRRRRA